VEIDPFYKQKTPRMWGFVRKDNSISHR
jgi:hypothetical protein